MIQVSILSNSRVNALTKNRNGIGAHTVARPANTHIVLCMPSAVSASPPPLNRPTSNGTTNGNAAAAKLRVTTLAAMADANESVYASIRYVVRDWRIADMPAPKGIKERIGRRGCEGGGDDLGVGVNLAGNRFENRIHWQNVSAGSLGINKAK